MVRKCVVCKCVYAADRPMSFHAFPTDEIFKNTWIEACNLKDFNKQMRVCSRHFGMASFKSFSSDGHNVLKRDAVPTLFLGSNCKLLKRIRAATKVAPQSRPNARCVQVVRQPLPANVPTCADHDYIRKNTVTTSTNGEEPRKSIDNTQLTPAIVTPKPTTASSTGESRADHDYTQSNPVKLIKFKVQPLGNCRLMLYAPVTTTAEANTPVIPEVSRSNVNCGLDHNYAQRRTLSPVHCDVPPVESSDYIPESSPPPASKEKADIDRYQESDMPVDPIHSDISSPSHDPMGIEDFAVTESLTSPESPEDDSNASASRHSFDVVGRTQRKIWRPARVGDCKEEHLATPEGAKRCFELAVKKLSDTRKKLDSSQRQIKKLQTKVKVLEDFIEDLLGRQFVSVKGAHNSKVQLSRSRKNQ